MRGIGIVLVIVGVLIAGAALLLDTTASTTGAFGMPSEVYNLGRLQQQMLVFVAGCALFVSGAAITAAGVVRDAMDRSARIAPAHDFAIPGDYHPAASIDPIEPTVDDREAIDERLAQERRTDRIGYILVGIFVVGGIVTWLIFGSHA